MLYFSFDNNFLLGIKKKINDIPNDIFIETFNELINKHIFEIAENKIKHLACYYAYNLNKKISSIIAKRENWRKRRHKRGDQNDIKI